MQITPYTTSEAVRAAIGVTDNEFSDDDLEVRALDLQLLEDLGTWVATHATIYSAGRTAEEGTTARTKYTLLLLYAMWFCALRISETHFAIPQVISDGKDEIRRVQKIDWEAASEVARRWVDYYKKRLLDESGETVQAAASLFGVSSPSYDPVTNT